MMKKKLNLRIPAVLHGRKKSNLLRLLCCNFSNNNNCNLYNLCFGKSNNVKVKKNKQKTTAQNVKVLHCYY